MCAFTNPRTRRLLQFLVLRYTPAFLFACALALLGAAKEEPPKPIWESQIKEFEAQDRQQPPPEGAILFVGGSSIRLWDVEQSFPNLKVIRRGFGGSLVRDSTYYADRIVIPYKPKTIVLYAGDNDIASGITAEQVFGDFQAFCEKVHTALPDARILFLSIKPSVKRWALYDEMKKANTLISDYANALEQVEFVDVGTPMLGDDGKPRADLFLEDGLHLNENGYKLWTSILAPKLAVAGSATEK
ncbi:MAG: hypothetical protein AMXMBFR4_00640 [Candidatus Hydrogenedentota bacterium]